MSRRRKNKDLAPKASGKAATRVKQGRGSQRNRPSSRVWGLRILMAVATPVLFLLLLEFGLERIDYGYPTNFFLEAEDGRHWVENNQFAWQFYSPDSQLRPHPFKLPKEKAADTIRIFALGESATLGTPESAYGFVRVLERMLQLRFPNHRFEVVNAAMPGINSHLIRSIAQDCSERQPDAFVVYMGNNEMVGLHAPGPDSQGLTDRLWLLRLIQSVRSSRTGQLLSPLTASLRPKQPTGEQDMDFFRSHRLSPEDPGRTAVVSNFRENLSDILGSIEKSGAKALLSTVVVNLRECPPLGSLHGPGFEAGESQSWQEAYTRGANHWAEGEAELALSEYAVAAEIDDSYAELSYRMALCYEQLGQVDKATTAFEKARDLDALPFRTVSALNDVIRDEGQKRAGTGFRLVESDRHLASTVEAPVKLPGLETFYEHVHFRFAGDHQIASRFFVELQSVLADSLGLSDGETLAPPSMDECAAALAYNRVNEGLLESSIMDMTSHAPFLDQMNHGVRKTAMQERLQERYGDLRSEDVAAAFRVYQTAMETFPDDWNLAYLLSRLHFTFHNFDAARANLKEATEMMPHVTEIRLGYTRALIETMQFEEAFRQIEVLEKTAPNSAEVAAARRTAKARQAAAR